MANRKELAKEVAGILAEVLEEKVSVDGEKGLSGTLAVDAVVEAVQGFLAKGETVKLTGFGNFEVRERAARKGRNPQSGEEMEIPATKVPAFKSAKALKELVKA
ncbi:HU family DNA-binding protein [Alkalihalophilus pseudofirmus]|uniref:HU family DNA-binding protein n=1 Tax=Alkalihalophilus pseudofirmus TaxID=79885 RepID=UPI00259BB3E6|nr:HU family DNA-binding protein [Alkalihalophilus pseudofirmus]WEG18518.1 HU family DNA-binding protein [Alkalihalophilus pseudofirmus]